MTEAKNGWRPPEFVTREQCIKDSEDVLSRTDIPIKRSEDIFRVNVLGMDWDLGMVVYEPEDPERIPHGADSKKAGFFLLHGGSGDFKGIERHSKLLAAKFGFKVMAGTFPGRFYFPDASRDWPDDTIHADGTVRAPIWQQGEVITPDQYEVVKDASMRNRYGTRTLARAKPESQFWFRMAGWPAAFEAGMIEANRRHFPEPEFSVYSQGHSTGGPFICMLSQRIPNMAGVCATEHSPFGYLSMGRDEWGGDMGKIAGYDKIEKQGKARTDPFNELYIRTWRDLARYQGPEALGQEGPKALMRLPAIMEDILDAWQNVKSRPQFKAEYVVTHAISGSLAEAARVSAARLKMNKDETEALVQRFVGYSRELSGPNVKPVPPFLFEISKDSRDHSQEVYEEVIMPGFRKMNPTPKIALTRFGAGVHSFWKAEKDLPVGIVPSVLKSWNDAVTGGYFAG
ncbi:MAG: hypothetical protein Q8S00_13970 [Deltaproteobacteria bacterium]|nr:hypothetical protein [Deltaproteobacteria bacterium]MDZ4342754.1 hypothetical protein [Candidatus Binatia bacterium]